MAARSFALAALLFAACPDRPVAAVDPRPQPETGKEILISTKLEVDILFVIDDSGSMGNEQRSLRDSFPEFMEVFQGVLGGLPDVHIGVVSSDMGTQGSSYCASDRGDDGALQNGDGLCPVGNARFISDSARPDGSREKNYAGSLEDAFACMADLGTGGCGFEQHLASMQRALSRSDQQDFLRKDALLAVIIIADEDDCSTRDAAMFDPTDESEAGLLGPQPFRCTQWGVQCGPGDGVLPRGEGTYSDCRPFARSPYLYDPQDYIDFLVGLKGGSRDKIMMASIGGRLEPFRVTRTPADAGDEPILHLDYSCEASDSTPQDREGAVPPVRIKAVLDGFADSVLGEICGDELSGSLAEIAGKLGRKVGNACLPPGALAADVFPDAPGLQPECSIVELVDGRETVIGRCELVETAGGVALAEGNDLPCWWARAAEGDECDTGESVIVLVERDGPPPPTASLRMRCVGETGDAP